jgi:hypothetical protein
MLEWGGLDGSGNIRADPPVARVASGAGSLADRKIGGRGSGIGMVAGSNVAAIVRTQASFHGWPIADDPALPPGGRAVHNRCGPTRSQGSFIAGFLVCWLAAV